MKGRIHRFERILRTREVERETVQRELTERAEREQTVEENLRCLVSEQSDALGAFCGSGERTLSVGELWFERLSLDQLSSRVRATEEDLRQAQADLKEAEADLVEKHRNVRIMELYVDKLRKGWIQSELKTEQALLDDLGGIRFRDKGLVR
jgi:flagellar export protein FliJ